ncbi:unnamed protein product, partial [Sphagnum compactum]
TLKTKKQQQHQQQQEQEQGSTEQQQLSITSGTPMWPEYCSDFSTLVEESLELQPMMMSYDHRSIDTNNITPSRSVTASCPASFSSFVDPLAADTVIRSHGMLLHQFQSAPGSTSSVAGEDYNLIKVPGEQEHELSWIDFDDGLNSAMMMSQEVEAAASTHEPLPSDQMSSLADDGAGVEKGAAAAVDEEEEEDQNKTCKTKKQLQSPILRPRKKGQMKRVKQSKYCIKTRTDVEIMDDNFKWRKYGQKAVKNSPYPRNYYRCSTQNCPVRKRVERCADDPGFVLTTYEGTHTHQSPAFARLPIGAYFGGFGQPFMDPLSQAAYIHSLGASAASLLPLFAQRDLTSNPNYVGSLSSSMLSHREALNSYYSRIGTIPPPSSISASQQFGGGQLTDPLLVKLQHMEYNSRSETQNSVLGTQSEMQSPQAGPMIDFSTHPSSGSQPMLQDASPQVWEAVRATQGRIAEAAALHQFDDNKFIEPAKLWSSGQDFVAGRGGLLRPPTTNLCRSLQAACRTDEGLLEDMIRPALPRYGLR